MATSVFYSFHYQRDIHRVQRVANIGALDGQKLNRQEWERVKSSGRAAIERYIDQEMAYKRALVVLIGYQTASRSWVQYEIRKAWAAKKPIVGVYINGLVGNPNGGTADPEGANPFAAIAVQRTAAHLPQWTLADYIPTHRPVGSDSTTRFNDIRNNIHAWIDNAYRRT